MDQIGEENRVKDFILELSNEEVTGGMDSNEIKANITFEKRDQNIKNKTGKEKLKTLNSMTKYMTVDLLPERKNLKRKAVLPSTSRTVMDSIKTLKTSIVSAFRNMKTFVKEKCVIYMKVIKNYVYKLLQGGVNNGVLEKTDEINAEEKSQIKIPESIKNDSQNLSKKELIEEPSTSEIITNSIKAVKKHIGTSFADIRKRLKEKYSINRNVLIPSFTSDEDSGVLDGAGVEEMFDNKFCQAGDYNAVHQKINKVGVEGKSKMKKPENIKKDSRNLHEKKEKVKPAKKVAVIKKQSNLFVVFVVIVLLLIVKTNLDCTTPPNRQISKSSRAR